MRVSSRISPSHSDTAKERKTFKERNRLCKLQTHEIVVTNAKYLTLMNAKFVCFYTVIHRSVAGIVKLYYVKNQQDATLAVLFISHCKITLHVSDAFCVHHQVY